MLNEIIVLLEKYSDNEQLNWDFIFDLWNVDYREAQYIALEYLQKHHKLTAF